jgi:hypothetical protein
VLLGAAQDRNDQREAKPYELTASLAHLVSQRDRSVAHTKVTSKASSIYHQGREVLYRKIFATLHLLGRDHH